VFSKNSKPEEKGKGPYFLKNCCTAYPALYSFIVGTLRLAQEYHYQLFTFSSKIHKVIAGSPFLSSVDIFHSSLLQKKKAISNVVVASEMCDSLSSQPFGDHLI
jgi:hypothetical protein